MNTIVKKIIGVIYSMNDKLNIGEGEDVPMGFGAALTANAKAMDAFSNMSEAEKQATVEKSRKMNSRAAMERFVNDLGESIK